MANVFLKVSYCVKTGQVEVDGELRLEPKIVTNHVIVLRS